jgi:hypothetical protein
MSFACVFFLPSTQMPVSGLQAARLAPRGTNRPALRTPGLPGPLSGLKKTKHRGLANAELDLAVFTTHPPGDLAGVINQAQEDPSPRAAMTAGAGGAKPGSGATAL